MKRMCGNGKLEAVIIRAKDEIIMGRFWRSDPNNLMVSLSHSPLFNSDLLTTPSS